MTSQEPGFKSKQSGNEGTVGGAQRSFSRRWWVVVAVLLIAAATYIFGIHPRLEARADLKKETANSNVTSVSVTKPKTSSSSQDLTLPGNLQAFSDTPIYARTKGYLKRWH